MKTEVLEILKDEHPLLKQISEEVPEITEDIKSLVSSMMVTMAEAKGVGLSAVQVGHLKRIFILDTRCEAEGIFEVFINPELVARKGSCKSTEGCLSYPGQEYTLKRYRQIRVKYTDFSGKEVTKELVGLTSVAFQHELDHLNGITFNMDEAGI